MADPVHARLMQTEAALRAIIAATANDADLHVAMVAATIVLDEGTEHETYEDAEATARARIAEAVATLEASAHDEPEHHPSEDMPTRTRADRRAKAAAVDAEAEEAAEVAVLEGGAAD